MHMRLLIFALLAVSLASAKTYTFTLSETTQAGSTKLKAGQYTLSLEGSKVILKDSSGHNVAATAKVENSDQEYKDTRVSVTNAGQGAQLKSIDVGGSKFRIVFE